MANIRDYVNTNLNEGRIGDPVLKTLADRAIEAGKSVPMGSSFNNRLGKSSDPKAKALAGKLAKAQKFVQECKEIKKGLGSLKDSDTAGRKRAKQNLQRVITGLKPMASLEGEIEKVLASAAKKSEVKDSTKKWELKKKDFKGRVKENLKRKRTERMTTVTKKAKDYVIKFTNEETLNEMAKADLEGITLSSPEAAAKAYIKKYEDRMGKDFDARGAGAAKRVIVAFIADKEDVEEGFADKMVTELKKLAKKTEKKPAKEKEKPEDSEIEVDDDDDDNDEGE